MLEVGYDTELQVLEVKFSRGDIARYEDVPEDIYLSLLESSSKGKFFDKKISPYFSPKYLK